MGNNYEWVVSLLIGTTATTLLIDADEMKSDPDGSLEFRLYGKTVAILKRKDVRAVLRHEKPRGQETAAWFGLLPAESAAE